MTLFADVATTYVQYRVDQQRIKIAQDNVRIQEGVLALAAEKFRVGTTNKLDVEQARTVLEQTRSTIPGQQILLGQANDTLCILLGLPPRDLEPDLGPGPPLGSSPIPNTPAWVAAGIPADLLRRRPDVRAAERAGRGPDRPDRRCRSRPLPHLLHQRHPRLGRGELLASVLDQELPGPARPRLSVEHPELRADPQ